MAETMHHIDLPGKYFPKSDISQKLITLALRHIFKYQKNICEMQTILNIRTRTQAVQSQAHG